MPRTADAIRTVQFTFKDRVEADRAYGIIETKHNTDTGIGAGRTVTIQDGDAAYAGWFAGELVQRGFSFSVEASE